MKRVRPKPVEDSLPIGVGVRLKVRRAPKLEPRLADPEPQLQLTSRLGRLSAAGPELSVQSEVRVNEDISPEVVPEVLAVGQGALESPPGDLPSTCGKPTLRAVRRDVPPAERLPVASSFAAARVSFRHARYLQETPATRSPG